MPAPSRIEAFAIISADGMIADAAGHMPDALKIEADQTVLPCRPGSRGGGRAWPPFPRGRAECGAAPSADRDQPRAPAGTRPGLPQRAVVEPDGRVARRSLERVRLACRHPCRHRRRGRLRAVLGRRLRCLPPHPRRAGSASRRPPGLSRPFNHADARKTSWQAMGCVQAGRGCSIRRPE